MDSAKNQAVKILRFLLSHFTKSIPIKKNRIICYSFNGNQYSCSPKAISEYLIKQYPEKYEIIWAFRKDAQVKKQELQKKYTCVTYNSLRFLYFYTSARFIITNIYPDQFLYTKPGQIVIDTWHGGGAYKVAGFDTMKNPTKQLLEEMEYNSKNISLFISSSEMFTKHFIRGGLHFTGEVLNTGLQRNDVLFLPEDEKKKIQHHTREKLGIKVNTRICLYAPTWRNDEKYSFIFQEERLCQALAQRFGGEWVVVSRMHHLTKHHLEGNVIDGSHYPEMQDLLLTADFLISDYSSAIWDYSLTKKPCLLYAYDLQEYLNDRSMYIRIDRWGFPLCETFDALIQAIDTFDETDFAKKMQYHYDLMGGYDKGDACRQLADYIRLHTYLF